MKKKLTESTNKIQEGVTLACYPFGFEIMMDKFCQREKFRKEMQGPVSNEYREELTEKFINGKYDTPFLDAAINKRFI